MRLIDADALEKEFCSGCQYENNKYSNCIDCALAHAPTIEERKWIPCSERLPKPFEHCLWTTTDGRVVYHHCDGLFSNYTAWMPLPEPYAERRTDEL